MSVSFYWVFMQKHCSGGCWSALLLQRAQWNAGPCLFPRVHTSFSGATFPAGFSFPVAELYLSHCCEMQGSSNRQFQLKDLITWPKLPCKCSGLLVSPSKCSSFLLFFAGVRCASVSWDLPSIIFSPPEPSHAFSPVTLLLLVLVSAVKSSWLITLERDDS